MAAAVGTAKVLAYKLETVWGDLAGPLAGKQLRRVTGDFNLTKETYESNEITSTRQISDMRHGVRTAEGSLNGELSPSSYSDFMQAIVARNFTVGAVSTTFSATIAASGELWTVTRGAGDFLVDGLNVGKVVALTGGLNALNVAKNLLIVSMNATVLTVQVLNGTAMFAEGPIATITATVLGKDTYVPSTGHTDQSFTVEEWYSDIAQSETYTGLKCGSLNIQLPATGLATVDMSFQGKDLTSTGVTQYFTSPTAPSADSIFAGVQGSVIVNGLPVALITSADFSIERALENAVVVGSDNAACIFAGRIKAMGNLSVYFVDAAFRNYFKDETVVSLVFAMTTNNDDNADFVSFTLPKVKLGSFTKADNELGVIASCSFQALLNADATTGNQLTTVAIQDSTL
jgi:hypothetical protein